MGSRVIIANVSIFAVLIAIELDHELGDGTIEIDDVGTDSLLPAETYTGHLFSAQHAPEFPLRFGGG
jgi:hypothetical protein